MEKRQRIPTKVKVLAVIMYFNGFSFRKVAEVLNQTMGIEVGPEAVRQWWHALAKFLQGIYTLAMFVYVDETKIKARNKRYILWIATTRNGKPTFVWLSNKRNSKTAKLVLYNSKGYVFITDKGPWYVKAVRELRCGWIHETFGSRNVVERFFRHIKHRMKAFYKRFPHNAKYETVWSWLASFIFIKSLLSHV
ncbi:hypothetical protein JCM9492_13370 [Aquifex pyrophilus]